MNHCTCDTGDADENSPLCPIHGAYEDTLATRAADICFAGMPSVQDLFGMRPVPNMPVAAPVGRLVDGGMVALRPKTTSATRAICGCDLPVIYGHDTGCEYHPAPILSDPLQLLVAATQLINDQPTTEQWQTIKKAIIGLVPTPTPQEPHRAD